MSVVYYATLYLYYRSFVNVGQVLLSSLSPWPFIFSTRFLGHLSSEIWIYGPLNTPLFMTLILSSKNVFSTSLRVCCGLS